MLGGWLAGHLFPAHAGVIPAERLLSDPDFAVPRTRGGDPIVA